MPSDGGCLKGWGLFVAFKRVMSSLIHKVEQTGEANEWLKQQDEDS